MEVHVGAVGQARTRGDAGQVTESREGAAQGNHPEFFDPRRTDAPPTLAFSAGIHFCPAAAYCRHLTHTLVTCLSRTLPSLSLTSHNRPPADLELQGARALPVAW
ncbi:hypothetical protein ACFVYT_03790 [Streptomyces sp. NPDC058290]|uniref:hypothetical protein n=1 Tax=Streptomyces sp. NPDC058290 TaxID=3346426 RepID=UPI0036F1433E